MWVSRVRGRIKSGVLAIREGHGKGGKPPSTYTPISNYSD
jgi:hypothetical protein